MLQLANVLFRSLVWRNVLAAAYPDRRVPVAPVAGAYAAGVALNAFTPARGGDLAKLALVRMQIPGSSLPAVGSALSVVLLLDGALAAAIVGSLWAFGVIPTLPSPPSAGPATVAAAAAALTLGVFLVRRRPAFARRLLAGVRQGAAILGAPRRYATTVVPFQLAAWCCRIGVVFFVLAAFRIHVPPWTAALLVVLNGLSTAVPVPGGVGTQQVLAAYALHGVAPVAAAVSFSVGLQLGVTLVNTVVGLAAMMLILRTHRPLAAVRTGLGLARRTPEP